MGSMLPWGLRSHFGLRGGSGLILSGSKWEFPKTGVPFLGVLIIGIGSPIFGNSQILSRPGGTVESSLVSLWCPWGRSIHNYS